MFQFHHLDTLVWKKGIEIAQNVFIMKNEVLIWVPNIFDWGTHVKELLKTRHWKLSNQQKPL